MWFKGKFVGWNQCKNSIWRFNMSRGIFLLWHILCHVEHWWRQCLLIKTLCLITSRSFMERMYSSIILLRICPNGFVFQTREDHKKHLLHDCYNIPISSHLGFIKKPYVIVRNYCFLARVEERCEILCRRCLLCRTNKQNI